MTDDIVTRLRELAIGAMYGINIAPFEHYNAAADEIERLQEELLSEKQTCQNWMKVAELMLPYVMASPEFAGKFAPFVMTQFTKKAVRGE